MPDHVTSLRLNVPQPVSVEGLGNVVARAFSGAAPATSGSPEQLSSQCRRHEGRLTPSRRGGRYRGRVGGGQRAEEPLLHLREVVGEDRARAGDVVEDAVGGGAGA